MQYLREMRTKVNGGFATGRQFQLHLYYQMDKNSDNTVNLTLTLKYYCWNLYLGSFDFFIKGSGPMGSITENGGKGKKYSTLAISDSNASSRHYGTIWSQTFYNLPQNTSYTFSLSCDYMRELDYSNQTYQGFDSNGSMTLTTPRYTTTLPTPLTPEVSRSETQRNTPFTISWHDDEGNGVPDASGYYLQYRKGYGSWINYGNVSSTSISLYLKNLSGYAIDSIFYFRVKAVGDGGVLHYDSPYSSPSSGVKAINSPAKITSLSVNKTYFSSGADYPTLTYRGSDDDGQTIYFDVWRDSNRLDEKTSSLSYIDKSLNSSGSYTYKVQIYDNKDSYKTVTIYKNSTPSISVNSSTISGGSVTIPINIKRGFAAGQRQSNGILTVKLFTGQNSDMASMEEKKTFTYQIQNSNFNNDNICTYELRINYNDVSDQYLPYIGEGQYYYFNCVFNDSIEDSASDDSTVIQRPVIPSYVGVFENVPLMADGEEVPRYETVLGGSGEIVYFDFLDDDANEDLKGRRRNYYSIYNKAKIKMTYTLNEGDSITGIQILKLFSTSPTSVISNDYVEIISETLSNGSYSDEFLNVSTSGNIFSGYFINEVTYEPQTQHYVRYKVVITNSSGINIAPSYTVEFITNTAPYFGSTALTTNSNILNITPNTNFANPLDLDIIFSLPRSSYSIHSNEGDEEPVGSEGDEAVEINGSYTFTCDKYEIELRFPENIIGSGETSTNIYKIKEFFLHEQTPTDPINLMMVLSFTDALSNDRFIGFEDILAVNKLRSYSNVELRIYAYDTFDVQSVNYISKLITIDFTDKPVFDKISFTISDLTNKGGEEVLKLIERPMPRLMNSGEEIEFSFPPARSKRNIDAGLGRGISEYQILYSINNQEFNILKSLPVGADTPGMDDKLDEKDPEDDTNYTYSYTIKNYNQNAEINFKIIAIDVGQNGARKLSSEEIFSDFAKEDNQQLFSDIMVCRKTNPVIQINRINFVGSEPSTSNLINLDYSIIDIGGSFINSPSDYFRTRPISDGQTIVNEFVYKNFERNITSSKKGQFLKIQIAFSEDSNNFNNWIDLNEIYNQSYFNDSVISFPVSYSDSSISEDGNKTYYVKLRIFVGTNINATPDNLESSVNTGDTIKGESPVYILRSLRPTMKIRDKKIGINAKGDGKGGLEYTFQVSAGDSNENYWVQFDSGLPDDNIIKFNLMNGHMVRGIIDCGRLA